MDKNKEIKGLLLKCEVCEQVFINQHGMRIHMTRIHKDKQKMSEEMLLIEKSDTKEDEMVCDTLEENIEEEKHKEVYQISASADGGPRSRVCARETLRSAPHRH